MKIIDAHSHIDYITHIYQKNVVGTVCCTTEERQWSQLINLMNQDKHIYGAFGIHPWFVDSVNDDFDIKLKKILQSDSNYMVGEIGIDKYKPDIDKQLDIFIKQFDLAVSLKRTVFLHCVGAWDKILHVFKEYNSLQLPFVVAHNFNANQDILDKLLRYDFIKFSIGINGINCRIERIPCDKILVETDGESNVSLTNNIKQIAKIKNIDNIDKFIFDNTQRIIQNG